MIGKKHITNSIIRPIFHLYALLSVNIMRIFWEVFLRRFCSRQEKSAEQKVLRKPLKPIRSQGKKLLGIFCISAHHLKPK